jgi:hypothetical protein
MNDAPLFRGLEGVFFMIDWPEGWIESFRLP